MKKIITIAIVALIALSCDKGEYPGPDNTIPVDDLVPRKDILKVIVRFYCIPFF